VILLIPVPLPRPPYLLNLTKPPHKDLRFIIEGNFAVDLVSIEDFCGGLDDFLMTRLTEGWHVRRGKEPAEKSFSIQDLLVREGPEFYCTRSKESLYVRKSNPTMTYVLILGSHPFEEAVILPINLGSVVRSLVPDQGG